MEKTVAERIAEIEARREQGLWIPSTGETPTRYRNGKVLQKCWQPSTGKTAFLNVETDIFLTDEEAVETLMS